MSTLIILPCHSIWRGGDGYGDKAIEWHLVDFQIEGNDHLCFKDHIIQSLKCLEEDQNSYLVISGGQTKREAGPISESLSYYQLAKKLVTSGGQISESGTSKSNDSDILDRITTEEFARDSFENVIFLICRYYEVFNKYPEKITIVGFEFKRDRFLKHHLVQAMKFPLRSVTYIGNAPDPKENLEKYFEDLNQSEFRFAVRYFQDDWYGKDQPLLKKKLTRNPFNRNHGYAESNPKLRLFLTAIHDLGSGGNEMVDLLDEMPWIR